MFFLFSKIFWVLVQPLNALCLLGIVGYGASRINRWTDAGQKMMNTALLGILIFGVFPLGPIVMSYLERPFSNPVQLPEKIDGLVLLGGAFEPALSEQAGHIVLNAQASRVTCFLELAKRYPKATLVFSGGTGDILNPEATEAQDAKAFFSLTGLQGRRIIYEDKSRNTFENAVYTKSLVKPKNGENWVLVTSAYHMPRALGVFTQQGWGDILPYGCDPKTRGTFGLFGRIPNVTSNFGILNLALKEYMGTIVYYVTGKTAFILAPVKVPSPQS